MYFYLLGTASNLQTEDWLFWQVGADFYKLCKMLTYPLIEVYQQFFHPYTITIGSTLDIIRIQIAVCHYSEYSIYTENISGWPTTLLWFSACNSTKPEYFVATFYLLACIYSLAAPLNSAIYKVLCLLTVIKWAHTLQPQLVLKIISQADSTCYSSKNAVFL